jgi:hypothetical protein
MGEVPELESSFDEIGDCKHQLIVHHLAYFQQQDGELLDDVIDQCVLDAQTSQGHGDPDNPVFCDLRETERGLPPEDSLPEPTHSEQQILTKRADDDNLCAPRSR